MGIKASSFGRRRSGLGYTVDGLLPDRIFQASHAAFVASSAALKGFSDSFSRTPPKM